MEAIAPHGRVHFLRAADGLLSAMIAAVCIVAIFYQFLLPVAPVSQMYASPVGMIAQELQTFCVSNANSVDASVTAFCNCVRSGSSTCADEHKNLPAVQVLEGWINPNFLLFYLFWSGFVYQLVLRNSVAKDQVSSHMEVVIAVVLCVLAAIVMCVLSVFQLDEPTNSFTLLYLLPQQIIVLAFGFAIYHNIVTTNSTAGAAEEVVRRRQLKNVLYNGLYKATSLPIIAVFIAVLQHSTSVSIILYLYNLLLFVALCDLAYGLVSVEVAHDPKHAAGSMRLQQSAYLATLAAITIYTFVNFVFLPTPRDPVLRLLGLFYVLLLWVLHVLYDAANSKENPKEHRRTFNVADGILASIRYSLFLLTMWLVTAPAVPA
jgi:hypothetical protein